MKSFIITVKGNEISEVAAAVCKKSHEQVGNQFDVETFDAITPDDVQDIMNLYNIKWTYPWDAPTLDMKTGLKLTPYKTYDKNKRIACFLSHYALWSESILLNEPIIVLEHDAVWTRKFNPTEVIESNFGVVGLNNPLYATRRADIFDLQINSRKETIQPIPRVDEEYVPQGLAGNSAYVIQPWAAKKIIDKVSEIGAWPNDAIMCKQLFPFLGVTKTYYTKVQRTQSTTSL